MTTAANPQAWTVQYNPKVLLLSASYMAVDVISWQDAMNHVVSGRGEIIEHYEDENLRIRSGVGDDGEIQIDIVCPSVIRLKDGSINQHNLVMQKPITRKTLYDQYHGKCCYCGIGLSFSEFTIEHVIPRSKGGLDTWDNISPCCFSCNNIKSDKSLEETGMKLRYKLHAPYSDKPVPKSVLLKVGNRIPSETWRAYIYWNMKTDEMTKEELLD